MTLILRYTLLQVKTQKHIKFMLRFLNINAGYRGCQVLVGLLWLMSALARLERFGEEDLVFIDKILQTLFTK